MGQLLIYFIVDIWRTIFIALIGKLLHVENTLILFKLSMVIEELALFIGVYLLAKRLFQHRATIIFICIGAMATTSWEYRYTGISEFII